MLRYALFWEINLAFPEPVMSKPMIAILKVLDRHQDRIVGSRELSRRLRLHGVELTERAIRYHLKIMDERGLTKVYGKMGRKITEKGLEELSNSHVSERVGFIVSKIETLSYLTSFDLEKQHGKIILNVSCFPKKDLKSAVKVMKPVFSSPYVMSDRVVVAHEGQDIEDMTVPEGMVGIGTVCSVSINGIFLRNAIPVTSKFGGVMEVKESGPSRFTSLISYEGSSLDPLLVFIKSGMTSIKKAIKSSSGKILASFREIPIVSIGKALELQEKLKSIGIGGILLIGNPNQPLFELPVSIDRAGMIVVGGLNPVAALEEFGIQTENSAMSTLMDYSKLTPFKEAIKGL
jgi:repressor of nif and glnA expression